MLLTKCHQIHLLPETSKPRLPEGILSTAADPRLSRARVYIATRRINDGYQYILLWDIFGADNFLQGWWSVPTFTSLDKFGTKHKTGVVSRFIPRFPRWDRNFILRPKKGHPVWLLLQHRAAQERWVWNWDGRSWGAMISMINPPEG